MPPASSLGTHGHVLAEPVGTSSLLERCLTRSPPTEGALLAMDFPQALRLLETSLTGKNRVEDCIGCLGPLSPGPPPLRRQPRRMILSHVGPGWIEMWKKEL